MMATILCWQAVVAALVICASLLYAWKQGCEYLRRRRANVLKELDPVKDFHEINRRTLFVEFPFLYRCAFEFGVMRTAGVPEIIGLLIKGGLHHVAKQYDDIDILIREMLLHHVDSPRSSLAVRRLNFLHSFYPSITNDDYLYVLALYVVTFVEWTDLYGYRKLTKLEKSCHLKVWQDIGTRMGIRDIPPTIVDLSRFRDEYEAKRMRYAECNRLFAEAGMNLMLSGVPKLFWPIVSRVLLSVLDERLLAAVGYPKQPAWLASVARSVLALHKFVVRWMPPRPLSRAQTRIHPCTSASSCRPEMVGACPLLNPELRLPLSFHRFKPHHYQKGYKIAELGGLKPGRIGKIFGGELLPYFTGPIKW